MTPHIRSLMIYDGHGRFRLLMVLYDGLSSTHDEHLPRAPKTLSVGNFPNFEGVDGTIGDTDATFPPWRCWDGPVCGRGSCYWVRSQDPNLNFGGSFFMSKRY